MAKTIKFNLILDGEPVRDLEGLKEHFALEDILRYYRSGLLQRWLKVRSFQDEYEKVTALNESEEDISVLKRLIAIFDIEVDEGELETIFDDMEYIKKERQLSAEYVNSIKTLDEYIEKYHKEYGDVISDLITNNNDMGKLKRSVDIINRRYKKLFELDFGRLYFLLKEEAPKAVFAILCNSDLRKYWMESENPNIMEAIEDDFLFRDTLKEILGDDLKSFNKNTNYEWECIEEKKKILILRLGYGVSVKEANADTEILDADDVKALLPIWNGVEFRSRNSVDGLQYMEV